MRASDTRRTISTARWFGPCPADRDTSTTPRRNLAIRRAEGKHVNMRELPLLSRNLVGDAVACEDAANAIVKEPALRRCVEQVLVHVRWYVEVVVDSSRRELDLQDAARGVVAGGRHHGRSQVDARHRSPPRVEMVWARGGAFGPARWRFVR